MQSCMAVFPMMKSLDDKESGKTYSHESYMGRFQTKQDVVLGFGSPSSRETIEGIELWHYNLGTTGRAYSTGIANTYPLSNYPGTTANTLANVGTTVNYYEQYVEFQFINDNVVSWRTRGVDYSVKSDTMGAYTAGLLVDLIIGILWGISLDI